MGHLRDRIDLLSVVTRLSLAVLLGSLAFGCSTSNITSASSSAATTLTVEEEIGRAAKMASGQPHLVTRYNPSRCQCPAFEVQLGPRWVRLEIAGSDSPGTPAAKLLSRALADFDAGKIPHYRFKGELSSTVRRCAQGAYFLSASIGSFSIGSFSIGSFSIGSLE